MSINAELVLRAIYELGGYRRGDCVPWQAVANETGMDIREVKRLALEVGPLVSVAQEDAGLTQEGLDYLRPRKD